MGAKSRNFRLKRSLSSNTFEKSCPSPFHQVPLVHGDDDAAPRALGLAGDRAVLIGRAKRRVDDQHDEVGVGNRALRQKHADRFDRSRARHAPGLPDACRVDDPELALMPAEIRVNGVARRAGDIADEHALLAQDAIDERRLPDVRAPDNRNPRLGLLRFLLFRFRVGQPLDHFVEEIADPHARVPRKFP